MLFRSITASAIMGPLVLSGNLPYHTVYIACAVGCGSLVGSWMNDSGFWIFAKMGGLTEVEALKSWTPLLSCVGVAALLSSLALAVVLPLLAIGLFLLGQQRHPGFGTAAAVTAALGLALFLESRRQRRIATSTSGNLLRTVSVAFVWTLF